MNNWLYIELVSKRKSSKSEHFEHDCMARLGRHYPVHWCGPDSMAWRVKAPAAQHGNIATIAMTWANLLNVKVFVATGLTEPESKEMMMDWHEVGNS